ncbi:MAG: hypothetical protein GY714_11980 [Desulfobacterales bacterium]|nr:hypothetical protein [Desulfobacterales bacterium]
MKHIKIGLFWIAALIISCMGVTTMASQIHFQPVTFEDMIQRSNCIVIAHTLKPEYTIEKVRIPRGCFAVPYKRKVYHYKIDEVLYSQKTINTGDTIEVVGADDETMFELYIRFYGENVTKSPIFDRYSSSIESKNKMILFLSSVKGRRYSYSCIEAYEDIKFINKVKKAVKNKSKQTSY